MWNLRDIYVHVKAKIQADFQIRISVFLNMKMKFKTAGFKITTVKQLCALGNKIIVETFWNLKV